MRHALGGLLTTDAILMPASATVYMQAVELRTGDVCGLDMSAANLYRWHPAYAAGARFCGLHTAVVCGLCAGHLPAAVLSAADCPRFLVGAGGVRQCCGPLVHPSCASPQLQAALPPCSLPTGVSSRLPAGVLLHPTALWRVLSEHKQVSPLLPADACLHALLPRPQARRWHLTAL